MWQAVLREDMSGCVSKKKKAVSRGYEIGEGERDGEGER